MSSYNEVNVRCPFYLDDRMRRKNYRITCEGISDHSTISQRFQNIETYKIQMKTFCCDRYTNCELYRILIEKEEYEDYSGE